MRYKNFAPKKAGFEFEFKQSEPQSRDLDINMGLTEKAMRDLPKSSYALKADPYTETNQASTAFPLIARMNKNIAPTYDGHANLEGGKASRFVSSLNTRLNKAVDSILMNLDFKYRYTNQGLTTITEDADHNDIVVKDDTYGLAINGKMMDAIAEAISQLNATTFTENAVINNYVVETNLNMPDGYDDYIKVGTGDSARRFYTHPAVVIFVMSLVYQVCVQNAALTVSTYNKMRSFMKVCLDHQYNKNINYVNVFDGQVKKAAFQNLLQTVSLDIQGEYFDTDWFRQINTVVTTPSAKSNSIWDPIIEIIGSNDLPFDFKISMVADKTAESLASPTTIFSSDDLKEVIVDVDDPDTETEMSFNDITTEISLFSSINMILNRARNTAGNVVVSDAVKHYNYLVQLYNAINKLTTKVKTRFTDLRTVFDVLKRTGIVNWAQDSYPTTFVKYESIEPVQYRLVDDIIRSTLSGGAVIKYDVSTGCWVLRTPWDMYQGIAEFDSKSGGCFISFCTKTIDVSGDNEIGLYIPRFFKFNNDSNVLFCLMRDGKGAVISRQQDNISDITEFSRLALLPEQDADEIFFPRYTFDADSDSVRDAFIEKTLVSLCGLVNGHNELRDAYTLDSTLIAMYDIQIIDVQNMLTAYGKTYGPIRGTAGDSPALGFKI